MKKMLALTLAGALAAGAGLLAAPQEAKAQVGFSVGLGPGYYGGGYYGRGYGWGGGPYVSVGSGYYGGYPYYSGYPYYGGGYGYYGPRVVTRRVVYGGPRYYNRRVVRRVVYR